MPPDPPAAQDVVRPDAILYPHAMKRGPTLAARLQHVQRTFGPALGGDRHTELGKEHGGRVHSRDVGGGMYLATLDPSDSLLHPSSHDEFPLLPRYRWEEQPDGTRHGFLLTDEELASLASGETLQAKAKRQATIEEGRQRAESRAARQQRFRDLAVMKRRTADEQAEFAALDAELFGTAREPGEGPGGEVVAMTSDPTGGDGNPKF